MPYKDKHQRVCGFLDIEEKGNSGHFLRRYFMLDPIKRILEYYLDNPQNLPPGNMPIGTINMQYVCMVNMVKSRPKAPFCFVVTIAGGGQGYCPVHLKANDKTDLDEWISHLQEACKISVPRPSSDRSSVRDGSYKAEIAGGVVVKTPLENSVSAPIGAVSDNDSMSSQDELEKERFIHRAFSQKAPVKTGYCTKQGFTVKNWKKRYFILDDEGISYYKSEQDKVPIKTILRGEIIEARISIGIHPNREHMFEIVTPHRVFYLQPDSRESRDSWICLINEVVQESKKPKLQEAEAQTGDSLPRSMESETGHEPLPVGDQTFNS